MRLSSEAWKDKLDNCWTEQRKFSKVDVHKKQNQMQK